MITLKTLETFLEKCRDAEAQVVEARKQKFDQIKELEEQREQLLDQLKVIAGQIFAIENLINIGDEHHVEIPFAGDDIEELHKNRLEGHKGMSEDEVLKFREKHAYLRESMDIVEQMDEANRAEDTSDESGGSEVDS